MAFIPAHYTGELNISLFADTTFIGQNTVFFQKEAAVAVTVDDLYQMIDFAASVFEELGDTAFGAVVDGYSIHARGLDTQFGPVTDTGVLPTNGSVSGVIGPTQATLCIKLGTGLAGRSYRGRVYHCGLLEGMYAGGVVSDVDAGHILDFWRAMTVDVGTLNPFYGVICSRFHNGAARANAELTPIIAATLTTQRTTTQRRRAKHNLG